MGAIDGEEDLYRRIIHYYYNERTGRISSSAFMLKGKWLDPEVSVFLARLSDPAEVLDVGLPKQKLVALKAQVPYDQELDVKLDPIDRFPGHCVIVGFGKNWKTQCARLAEACQLVEVPESSLEQIDPA